MTFESLAFSFGVLHLGEQTLTGGLATSVDEVTYEQIAQKAAGIFQAGDFAAILRFLDESFDTTVSLRTVFRDQQREIIGRILSPVLEEAEESYRRLYEEHVSLIRFLVSVAFPVPHHLAMAAQTALNLELQRALGYGEFDSERARALIEEGTLAGVHFETQPLANATREMLERLAGDFDADPWGEGVLERLLAAATLLPSLPFSVNTGKVQAVVFRAMLRLNDETVVAEEAGVQLESLGQALKVRI